MDRFPQLPNNYEEEESSGSSEPVYDEESESEDGFDEDPEMCYVSRTFNNQKCVMYDDEVYSIFDSLDSSVKRIIDVICPVVRHPNFHYMVRFAAMLVSPINPGSMMDTGLLCVDPGCVSRLDQLAEHIRELTQFSPVFTNEQLIASLSALYLIFQYAADVFPPEYALDGTGNMVARNMVARPHLMCRALMLRIAGNLPANPTPTFMVDLLEHGHCRLERYGNHGVWVREELEMETAETAPAA